MLTSNVEKVFGPLMSDGSESDIGMYQWNILKNGQEIASSPKLYCSAGNANRALDRFLNDMEECISITRHGKTNGWAIADKGVVK
jgi:hypothetical protein